MTMENLLYLGGVVALR